MTYEARQYDGSMLQFKDNAVVRTRIKLLSNKKA